MLFADIKKRITISKMDEKIVKANEIIIIIVRNASEENERRENIREVNIR
jgi:hypothetical protein